MGSGITVSGFTGSTLDTASIVSQLMSIERQPLVNLQFRRLYLGTRQEAVRSINTKMLAAYTAANSLISSTSSVWTAMTSQSGDTSKLTGSVTSSALAATYSILIDQLAKANTIAGDKLTLGQPLNVAGQFTIGNGTQSAIVTAAASDTLESLAGKINATGIGVQASIVDGTLRIARTSTGNTQLTLTDQFNVVTKSTSTTDPLVASSVISGSPTIGTYNIEVTQLAAFRVSSDVQADAVTPLGKTGSFTINGQAVDIAAGDNLTNIAAKIDALVGVTSYVSSNRLVIVSDTGADLTAADTAGPNNVLQELGVLQADNVTFKTIEANADSQVKVNGVLYTKSSNILTGADSPISGLDLTLSGVGTATISVIGNGAVMQQLGFLDGTGALKADAAHRLVVGQDSIIRIDGQTVQRSTNVISDAMTGVTLNLLAQTTTAVQFDVKKDTDFQFNQIKAFVDAYNGALDTLNSKVDERKVYNAKTSDDKLKGVLYNDSQLTRIKNTLMKYAGDEVTGLPADYAGLASIGITTSRYVVGSAIDTSGKLVIDETKLKAALAADPAAVKEVFVHNATASPYSAATSGFAVRIKQYMQPLTTTGGELYSRADSIQREIDSVDNNIGRMELRLNKVEAQYKRKFAQMETMMSQLQSQSSWMSSVLSKSTTSTSTSTTGVS